MTSIACLLFAVIDTHATYWAFGFPAAVTSVVGADFVFATGTLYVAKIARPDEQSLAGALFQTLTQLGTAMGLTISTIVHNSVVDKDMRALPPGMMHDPTGLDAADAVQLRGIRAAQWCAFAFPVLGEYSVGCARGASLTDYFLYSTAGLLGFVFLRGVGVVGHRRHPLALPVAIPKAIRRRGGEGTQS